MCNILASAACVHYGPIKGVPTYLPVPVSSIGIADLGLASILIPLNSLTQNGDGGGRSDSVGGRSPGCIFWVLPKISIPKPDQHRKDIIQQDSLGTDML